MLFQSGLGLGSGWWPTKGAPVKRIENWVDSPASWNNAPENPPDAGSGA